MTRDITPLTELPELPELLELVERLAKGDMRALARALTYIEDGGERGEKLVELLYPRSGRAYVVGITGAPGAGKSTLTDQLVSKLVEGGKRVGVIAVDPSSPFSGGALLGDRIRMTKGSEQRDVFIRSVASRGALGGLSSRTAEAIFAFDACGFDYVLVETVGVGQGEVEIVRTADTVLVVLVPGMGDGVQALKAGILEIADVFVINKSDYDGADRLEKELRTTISLGGADAEKPAIVRTVATDGTGAAELLAAVTAHRERVEHSGRKLDRRNASLRRSFESTLGELLLRDALERNSTALEGILQSLYKRERAPSACARAILEQRKQGRKR